MPPSRKQGYREGDWIVVPLVTGGFAIGIVFRGRGSICLGAFFAPKYEKPPVLIDADGLTLSDAILIARFGYLGLMSGEWTNLGRAPDWNRANWPMPRFRSTPYIVEFSDRSPGETLSMRRASPEELAGLPEEGVYGDKALQIALTKVLESPAVWDAWRAARH